MSLLNRKERSIILDFLSIQIPDYISEYSDMKYDLMDCYEVGFVFANDLLRNKKINPILSPWGDGKSVIFESSYSQLLLNIIADNLSEDINNYCKSYLKVLDVFNAHLIWDNQGTD